MRRFRSPASARQTGRDTACKIGESVAAARYQQRKRGLAAVRILVQRAWTLGSAKLVREQRVPRLLPASKRHQHDEVDLLGAGFRLVQGHDAIDGSCDDSSTPAASTHCRNPRPPGRILRISGGA
jgi:hypothetical protein